MSPTRLLLVALPLVALAMLAPSTASAGISCGNSSSDLVYCTAPSGVESGGSPTNTGKTPKIHHHAKADTSPTIGEEPAETKTEPEAEPNSNEGHRKQAVAPPKGGNPPGGGKPSDNVSQGRAVAGPQGSGTNVGRQSEGPTTKGLPASASSGGSSPVLPILVAIVVLAAISIGVVFYRERKGGSGKADYTGARG